MTTLSQVLREEVENMLEAGLEVSKIAEETGLSKGTVYKIKNDAGIRGRVKDPLEGVDVDKIVGEYRAGRKVREICADAQMDPSRFYIILAQIGEPIRKYNQVYNEGRLRQIDEACRMYEAGEKIRVICLETGISQTQLHSELAKRGIVFRQDWRRKRALGSRGPLERRSDEALEKLGQEFEGEALTLPDAED